MAYGNIWKLSGFFGALGFFCLVGLFFCVCVCVFCFGFMCVWFCLLLFVFFKSVGALPRGAAAWITDVFV